MDIKLATTNFVIRHSRIAFLPFLPTGICIHIFKFLNTLNWDFLNNEDIQKLQMITKHPQPTQFGIEIRDEDSTRYFHICYKSDVDSVSSGFVLVVKPVITLADPKHDPLPF
jgi:hypothetical protein